MKKLFVLAAAAMFVCGAAMAQEPEQQPEKKKKGGFLNALKKGVESATGLDVSKETLFVYPEIGQWKFTLASCEGDPATGQVVVKLNINKLSGDPLKNAWANLKEARVTGSSETLKYHRSADPFYDYEVGKPVEVTFQTLNDVPRDAKSLDLKFYFMVSDKYTFEARDVPITWLGAE
jgi:hypothetical protein